MNPTSHPPLSARRLSQLDASTIYFYGRDMTQDTVAIVAESVYLGAYGIFFGIAVYSILRRGLKSRGSLIMLVVVIYLYAASVIQWALDLTGNLRALHALLMVPDVPIPARADVADALGAQLVAPGEGLFAFNMIIGDSVVIWRTWAVYQGRMLAIVLPCVLVFASFVFSLIDITCNADGGPLPGRSDICLDAALISWAFSVTTNITCTILIGLKARQHQKLLRELNTMGKPRRMSTEHILSLLVESGFIYSLLWLTQVIAYFNVLRDSPWIYPYKILQPLGNQISGMYPTIIIVIVNFHRTVWDQASVNMDHGPALNSLQCSVAKGLGPTNTFNTKDFSQVA